MSAIGLAGCGATPNTLRNGGDPGNHVLHAIEADPVFAQIPPGESSVGEQRQPATYENEGFDGSSWQSPIVTLCLRTSQPAATVATAWAVIAQRAGWTPFGADVGRPPLHWYKPGPGPHVTEQLTLYDGACPPLFKIGDYWLTATGGQSTSPTFPPVPGRSSPSAATGAPS